MDEVKSDKEITFRDIFNITNPFITFWICFPKDNKVHNGALSKEHIATYMSDYLDRKVVSLGPGVKQDENGYVKPSYSSLYISLE